MRFIVVLTVLVLPFLASCQRDLGERQVMYRIAAPVPKKLIVIDAGHGGKDPGSESRKFGYEEKNLTLETARLVADYLRDQGYRILMTRDTDRFVSLSERAEFANRQKADLFVSLHYNYCANKEVEGIEIFYYDSKVEARKKASHALGKVVLARLMKHTQAESRGVKSANYAVIRETEMPAILVEGGFLSHPGELRKLQDPKYIRFLAYGIARGIDAYCNE